MKIRFGFIFLVSALVAQQAFAWADVGHELVAEIAWSQLDLSTKKKINRLLKLTAPFYAENKTFVTSSKWADFIKDGISAYDRWHYINQTEPSEDNIVFALCESTKTLLRSKRDFDKAWMLPMLVHLVGDAHQPMHAMTRYTTSLPKGDQGGNLFFIQVDGKRVNLHLYWDLGVGLLGDVNAPYRPQKTKSKETSPLAKAWMIEFPKTHFAKRIQSANFSEWIKVSAELAKQYAYQIEEGATPSPAYVQSGQKVVKEQVVLAGYRLAYLLSMVIEGAQPSALGCAFEQNTLSSQVATSP